MFLSLLQSDTKTADFGFEACDVADCPDSNATKLVCATTGFDEFARVFVSRSPFFALLCSLLSGSVSRRNRGSDACHQEREFSGCSACGIARGEKRHAALLADIGTISIHGPGIAVSPRSTKSVNEIRSILSRQLAE
jgi:hypothetical protein